MNNNSDLSKNNAHQKSIFSYNVYRTSNVHHHSSSRPQQRITNTFRVAQMVSPQLCKDPQILYVNDKMCKSPPPTSPHPPKNLKEGGTQTSRTILQLAQSDLVHLIKDQNLKTEQEKKEQDKKPSPAPSSTTCEDQKMYTVFYCSEEIRKPPKVVTAVEPDSFSCPAKPKVIEPEVAKRPSNRLVVKQDRSCSPIDFDEEGKEKIDTEMSPDSLANSPRYLINNYSMVEKFSDFTLDGSCHEEHFLDKTFLSKQSSSLKSKSFIDYQHPNYIQEMPKVNRARSKSRSRNLRKSCKSLDTQHDSFGRLKPLAFPTSNCTYLQPTAASQIKSQMEEIKSANSLIPAMRRGKSTSPKPLGDKRRFESSKKIPYIDQSKTDFSSSTTLVNATRNPERLKFSSHVPASKSEDSIKFPEGVLSLMTNINTSDSSFNETTICLAINKLQEADWRLALKGLAEVVEISRVVDSDLMLEYMNLINHKLMELLRSPRSHVCRTACQAAGHLFEYVKDIRGPMFDDIVSILLHKTADANKFIRQDANMALDCMVTHIPTFNAVRALCTKGPTHKNALVRCATARLLVCAVVIAGVDSVLHPHNNECTRKRLISTMVQLMEDKNLDTRKLAERLYKVLSKDVRFEVYLKKYLERDQIEKIKRNLKFIHKR